MGETLLRVLITHVQNRLVIFALFMGTALSISALPIIARILVDLNLMQKETGVVVMAAATINDLIGWTLFALILSALTPGGSSAEKPWVALTLTLGFSVAIVYLGRYISICGQLFRPFIFRFDWN